MRMWILLGLGFVAGAGGSWVNSFLTEIAVKSLFSSRNPPPAWGAGLFGLFFITKLLVLFAFCYAVVRFLHFSLWGVIAGILTHQILRQLRLAYLYINRQKGSRQANPE